MGWDTGIRTWDRGWIRDGFGIWIQDGFGIQIWDGFGIWVWDGYDGLGIGRVMDTGWDMGWDMDMGWVRDGAVVVIGPWGLWGWDAAVSPKAPPGVTHGAPQPLICPLFTWGGAFPNCPLSQNKPQYQK